MAQGIIKMLIPNYTRENHVKETREEKCKFFRVFLGAFIVNLDKIWHQILKSNWIL